MVAVGGLWDPCGGKLGLELGLGSGWFWGGVGGVVVVLWGMQVPEQKGQAAAGGGGCVGFVLVRVGLWERSHLVAVVRLRRAVRFPLELGVVGEVAWGMEWVGSGPGDGGGGDSFPVVLPRRASSARFSHSERTTSSWMTGTRMRRRQACEPSERGSWPMARSEGSVSWQSIFM